MIELARTTDALPVISSATFTSYDCSFTPADFDGIGFSPALLLPVAFPESVTFTSDYREGLNHGICGYFDVVAEGGPPVEKPCDARTFIFETLEDEEDAPSLPWRIGYLHGWLSVLALTDRALAVRELALLSVLVSHFHQNGAC